jgi:hypothetical protein
MNGCYGNAGPHDDHLAANIVAIDSDIVRWLERKRMDEVKQQIAAINARIAKLGRRHGRALAQAMKYAPTLDKPMTLWQQRKFEKYRRASLALLGEIRMAADELLALTDRLLDEHRPPLTAAERAQVSSR